MSPYRTAHLLAAAVFLIGGFTGCAREEQAVPAGQLRIATGSPGGTYVRYGDAIADVVRKRLPQLRPSVLNTAASAQNLRMVALGEAEIGFAQADTADEARKAGAPVVALARLYDDYLHLVVRAGSPVHTLTALKGQRVSIGPEGSGTIVTVRRLLEVARVDPDRDLTAKRLGLDDSVKALEAGEIDAFFFSGGPPVNAIKGLKDRLPIRLVDLGDNKYPLDLRRKHGNFYATHAVPGSTYGMPAVTTIGIPNYLVVSRNMPEDTAYALIRALYVEREMLAARHPVAARLNVREAINTHPLDLHAGAERWYRENKP